MTVLLVVVLVYAAWGLLLFLTQRQMLFPGRGLPPVAGVRASLPEIRGFRIPLPGGEVEAWFLPPSGGGPAPAVLFTHGNAELIDHAVHEMASFASRGVGVMLVEYPGFGRSEGTPSYATVMAAVLAAYDELAGQPEVHPGRIVAYGRSVGGGPAAALTLERRVAALVLQSAFTSLRAFARRYLLPGFLVRDRFEVLDAVRVFDGPVLVFHGRGDGIIPYAHGVALAEGAADGTLVTWDCAHNDCPPAWEPHVDRVMDFLRRNGIAE